MKRWIAYILTPWMIYAQDLDVRTISRTNDTRNTTTKQLVSWYQGEKVQYDLWIRAGTNAMYVPGTSTPIWYATDTTLTNYYLFLTGTVVSAAGGQVRFVLPSTLSGLAAATYESAVVIYDGSPTGQPPRLVGDRIQARVQWSPNYSGLYVGPFPRGTNYYIDENTIVLPNFWSQYEPDILAQLNLDTGTISAIQANNVLTSNSLLTAVGLVSSNNAGLGVSVSNWQVVVQGNLSFISNRVDINSGAISTAQTDIVRAQLTGTVAYAYAISVSNSLGASVAAAQAAADTAQATGVAAFVYAGSASATGVAAYALAGVASNLARQALTTGSAAYVYAQAASNLANAAFTEAQIANQTGTVAWLLADEAKAIAVAGSNLADSAYTLATAAATGSPVYVESDPIWTAASTGYVTKVTFNTDSMTIRGGTITNLIVFTNSANGPDLDRASSMTIGYTNIIDALNVKWESADDMGYLAARFGDYGIGQPYWTIYSPTNGDVGGSFIMWHQGNRGGAFLTKTNPVVLGRVTLPDAGGTGDPIQFFADSTKLYTYRGGQLSDVTNELAYVSSTVAGAFNSDALGGLPAASYLTLVAFQSTQTNYARFLSSAVAPATPTNTGANGEIRVDATNLYLYVARSNRWLRIPGSFSW